MENHEELAAKAKEIAKGIEDVLARHSPQPRIVFLAALSASFGVLAESIKEDGGPSAEETMNRFIEYTAVCFATCNKNNA